MFNKVTDKKIKGIALGGLGTVLTLALILIFGMFSTFKSKDFGRIHRRFGGYAARRAYAFTIRNCEPTKSNISNTPKSSGSMNVASLACGY